jgi:hypothetical protein
VQQFFEEVEQAVDFQASRTGAESSQRAPADSAVGLFVAAPGKADYPRLNIYRSGMHYLDYDPDDIDVRIAELLMATTDSADPLLHPKVQEALHVLRERLSMDVVFVSQFKDGRRTFRVVDTDSRHTFLQAGMSDPLEQSWCQHVVDGRIPQFIKDAQPYIRSGAVPHTEIEIGTHLSTPVILKNGEVYGTLCCFSASVQPQVNELDLRRLQVTAQLLAQDLHEGGVGAELELTPLAKNGAGRSRS